MERPNMTVNMIGIMYFGICGNGRNRILLPNGTSSDGHIPPHFASIFVEESAYVSDNWWSTNRIERPVLVQNGNGESEIVNMLEFRIPAQARLHFPDHQGDQIDLGNLEHGLIRMRDIDPDFVPEFRPVGNWIAQIQIRSGDLQAFTINGGVSAVQWQIQNDLAAMKMTAVTTANNEARSVTVRSQDGQRGTEVVLANAPDLLALAASEGHHWSAAHHSRPARVSPLGHRHTADEVHHFKLYGHINVTGDDTNLNLPNHYQSIPSDMAMFKVLNDVDIQASCSSTCC